jgi:hypothetical protein
VKSHRISQADPLDWGAQSALPIAFPVPAAAAPGMTQTKVSSSFLIIIQSSSVQAIAYWNDAPGQPQSGTHIDASVWNPTGNFGLEIRYQRRLLAGKWQRASATNDRTRDHGPLLLGPTSRCFPPRIFQGPRQQTAQSLLVESQSSQTSDMYPASARGDTPSSTIETANNVRNLCILAPSLFLIFLIGKQDHRANATMAQ